MAALKVPSDHTRGLPFLITVVQLCHRGAPTGWTEVGAACTVPAARSECTGGPARSTVHLPPERTLTLRCLPWGQQPRSDSQTRGLRTAENALGPGARPTCCSKIAFPKHKPPSVTKTNRYTVKDHCTPCHCGGGGEPPSQDLHTQTAPCTGRRTPGRRDP